MNIEEAYKAMEGGAKISRPPIKKHIWWYFDELGNLRMHSVNYEVRDSIAVVNTMMDNRDHDDWEVL